MSNLQITDPIGHRMRNMLRNFWHPAAGDLFRSDLFPQDTLSDIKIDVAQEDGGYVVRADLPGVKKEDIHVDVQGNQVSISAEVSKETEEKKGEAVVYSERYQGKVFRSFSLDCELDQAKAEAAYKDGVLTLKLPRKPGGNGTRVNIA
ncbi:MAG: Hsp20/alpha crystallin family protein [Burkholderiales bacterium]|nr:Hsp20/alpha crystallin family protein [Burkholderiales bacterium]